MSERTHSNSANTGTPVQPPHFDDERTVLSARRVVPLEQINAKVRHRRHWLLGGAFAIAMMLGAASALAAFYLNLRNVAPPPVAEVEVSSAPLAVAESVPAESPVVEEGQSQFQSRVRRQKLLRNEERWRSTVKIFLSPAAQKI